MSAVALAEQPIQHGPRGASLPEVSRDGWPLLLFAALTLSAAALRFRKRLD